MSSPKSTFRARVEAIVDAYGEGPKVGMPSRDAWTRLAEISADQPVTLVNFFKIRDRASYPADFNKDISSVDGETAFNRYASVSAPSLEKVGGRFLLVAPFGEPFIGGDEDWDLVAIGSYPGPDALFSLFELPEYRHAYVHRTAACSSQRVSLCIG